MKDIMLDYYLITSKNYFIVNYTMKKIAILLILFFLFTLSVSCVLAQTNMNDLESCFAYYDYGKIHANLAAEKNSYTQGEIVKIQGTIVNSNKFPLVGVVLYAHLKRENKTATFSQNGHYLVDRLTLTDNLNFLPGETKAVNVKFPIPPNYSNGQYQLHYFLFSKYGFHYGGRPFLEEDTAGYSNFEIINTQEPNIYFDINSLKINNTPHNIREQISEYNQEPLTFDVPLTNKTATDTVVSISIYSFEDTFETNKIDSEEKKISAGSSNIKYTFIPKDPGAYVILFQTNSPIRSLLKYRFAVKGNQADELRMNDLGITNFPPNKNKDRAYVCFHSPTPNNTPETKVTLFLLDGKKQPLDSKIVIQSFPGDVQAISLPLTKLTDLTDFWLKVEFVQTTNPQKSKIVEIHYDQKTFKDSVTSVDVSYDNGNLILQPANVLGKAVDKGYIESVRIKDSQGKVVQEAYNLTSAQKLLSVKKLPEGAYTAEVKSGRIKKELAFNISDKETKPLSVTPQPVTKKPNLFIYIIIIVVITTIGVITYLWWRKKQHEVS